MSARIGVPAAAALLAAAVLAGCGSDGGSSYQEPTGAAKAKRTVESGNLFFRPKAFSVPAGIVAITLKNTESGNHTFVIKGVSGFELAVSGDGDTSTKKVDLKPGRYEFYCTITGHKEAGMDGTLTVR